MKELPNVLVRIDDGERFVLNDSGFYELEMMQKFKEQGHRIGKYSYDTLMNVCSGKFKVEGGSK